MEKNHHKWITVKTFTYPHEAYITQGRLESEGIPTYLKDEFTIQVFNFYSNAIGGVKLQVPDEYVNEARTLLAEEEPEKSKTVILHQEEISDKACCPFCGSRNIMKKKSPYWLTLLPYIVLGFIFPVYRHIYTCFSCNQKWRIIPKKRH